MALVSRTVLLLLLALCCGGVLAKAYHYDEEGSYETAVWDEDDLDESFPSEAHASYEVDEDANEADLEEDADEADLEEEAELVGREVAPARQLPGVTFSDATTVHEVPKTNARKGKGRKNTAQRRKQADKYQHSKTPLKGKAYSGKRFKKETPEDFAMRNEARKNMEKNLKRTKPTRKEDDGKPSGAQLKEKFAAEEAARKAARRNDPYARDHLAAAGFKV